VRIFTSSQEVPFAGHPNIGTAFILASCGELDNLEDETQVIFEEQAGLVPITIRRLPDSNWWCELQAPQPLFLGKTLPVEQIASILSLVPGDISVSTHKPQQASVGLPFVMVEVKSRAALGNIAINVLEVQALVAQAIQPFIYVYARSNEEVDLYGRMFALVDGVVEDPATGSANCALAAMLTHYDTRADGPFSWRIAQGIEMNRPGRLDARTEKRNGAITGVWIGGRSVVVSQGYIHVA